MKPHSEKRGGLIGQLRDQALRGSDDGSWNEPFEQKSIVSRSVTVRGNEGDIVRVDLEAKKVRQDFGALALRTFYTFHVACAESSLTFDCLPKNVIEALRRRKIRAGDDREGVEVEQIRVDHDEVDEHEFDGYEDDMSFQHIRSLDYVLDGRGRVLLKSSANVYEDTDDTGVEITGVRTKQFGNLKEQEAQTISLQGWGNKTTKNNSIDFILHPDLRKLEAKTGAKELRQDMLFLDIVNNYVIDKRLLQHSHYELSHDMQTLLAFLNFEASAKDIQELL